MSWDIQSLVSATWQRAVWPYRSPNIFLWHNKATSSLLDIFIIIWCCKAKIIRCYNHSLFIPILFYAFLSFALFMDSRTLACFYSGSHPCIGRHREHVPVVCKGGLNICVKYYLDFSGLSLEECTPAMCRWWFLGSLGKKSTLCVTGSCNKPASLWNMTTFKST